MFQQDTILRKILFTETSEMSSSEIRILQPLTDWMRTHRISIHPEKRHRDECAVPSELKDSIPQLKCFSVFFRIVLMEVDV